MRLTVRSPATLVDIGLYGGASSLLEWDCLKLMRAKGETFVISTGDDVLALCCLFPHPSENVVEATFSVQPAAAMHMLALCRVVRLTLAQAPYPAIVTVCRTKAGTRIARASGFAHRADSDLGEVWEYVKSDFGDLRGRRRCPAETGTSAAPAGAGPAAPPAGGFGAPAGRD